MARSGCEAATNKGVSHKLDTFKTNCFSTYDTHNGLLVAQLFLFSPSSTHKSKQPQWKLGLLLDLLVDKLSL